MFDLGMQELIVIFVVALLVFGPKKLPELSRTLGKGVRELKMALRGVQDSIEEAESGISEEILKEKEEIKERITESYVPKKADSKGEAGTTEPGTKPGTPSEEHGKGENTEQNRHG